jgi:hypothetical protein
MEGIKHLGIIVIFFIGLFIGNVLIDLDHTGSWKNKYINFFRLSKEYPTEKGILHNKFIMLSLSIFFIGLGGGIFLHYIMDFC